MKWKGLNERKRCFCWCCAVIVDGVGVIAVAFYSFQVHRVYVLRVSFYWRTTNVYIIFIVIMITISFFIRMAYYACHYNCTHITLTIGIDTQFINVFNFHAVYHTHISGGKQSYERIAKVTCFHLNFKKNWIFMKFSIFSDSWVIYS